MEHTYTRAELLLMTKKQLVNLAGYKNIKALCNDIKNVGKAPSRKQLVRDLL